MKALLFICCCWLSAPLGAQSYYVATVRGAVYRDSVPLQRRQRVSLQDTLHFGSSDAYVRLAGPTGLHTLRPARTATGDYELLAALREELLPKAKPSETFAMSSALTMEADAFNFHNTLPVLDGYRAALKEWASYADRLAYLYIDTSGHYRLQPLPVVADSLVLRRDELRAAGERVAVVLVQDSVRLRQWLADPRAASRMKATLRQVIGGDVFSTDFGKRPQPLSKVLKRPRKYPAIVLDYLVANEVLDRASFLRDVYFYYDLAGVTEVNSFLYDYDYIDYFEEVYGPGISREFRIVALIENALRLRNP